MQNILNLDSLVNKKAVSHNNKEGSRGQEVTLVSRINISTLS